MVTTLMIVKAGVIILLCLLRSTLQSSRGESNQGKFQSWCGYCSIGCGLKILPVAWAVAHVQLFQSGFLLHNLAIYIFLIVSS